MRGIVNDQFPQEARLQGIMVVVLIKTKYPVQDDHYIYHDSLQACLTIRHACRESW